MVESTGLYLMGSNPHGHHERGIDIAQADNEFYEEEVTADTDRKSDAYR